MKILKMCILSAVCLAAMTGCTGNGAETPEYSETVETTASAESEPITAKSAYEEFLAGDVSRFGESDISAWGLEGWQDVLSMGGLEYTYLDIDGDGEDELLVQYADDPGVFNGVFDCDGERLYCRQYDGAEGSCRDYPLRDGAFVRQYDFGGARTYTVFRYAPNGETVEIGSLFARDELSDSDSTDPCPYYAIAGEEVSAKEFDKRLKELITDNLLDSSAWTAI